MSREEERKREDQRLRSLKDSQPETDDFPGTGVLLSDGIKFYCDQFGLISPFREKNLKPANYKLRVGDQYAIRGQLFQLGSERGSDEFTIPPFEVAIIKTLETINMPRFLIARWNIQVQRAYEGLLWVGGPQVDAGYVGHLFCPIYNLSNKPVPLRYDEPFAVIDFTKTTEFQAGESLKYDDIPDRILFDDYHPEALRSALAEQITSFRDQIDRLDATANERIKRLENITFTALAVLFAALAVIATSQLSTAVTWWTFLALGVSVLAIMIALGNR
jgi:deoxycytidine triphosphate deaminase